MKPKLILQPNQYSSFTSSYLESIWSEYFNIEIYDVNKTYSKKDLFVCVWSDITDTVQKLKDSGHKIVVDHLWECRAFIRRPNLFYLTNKNWFWYNEAIWWHSLNYHNYVPNKQIKKLAFMPIRNVRPDRDKIVQGLSPWLDNFLYSYKSITLPNDISATDDLYQRYFNPEWYDQTFMSLVVETDTSNVFLEFITEKTYKPIAFRHPFMIIGIPDHLKHLRSRGFVTFDNLFDESYDQIRTFEQRLAAIIDNLKQIDIGNYDAETLRRLEHNHHHFFDVELCRRSIVREIIEPLLHYAET